MTSHKSTDDRDIIVRLNGIAAARNFGGYPADRATLLDAVREIQKLRDVLTWSEENCTGECKGIVAAALRREGAP